MASVNFRWLGQYRADPRPVVPPAWMTMPRCGDGSGREGLTYYSSSLEAPRNENGVLSFRQSLRLDRGCLFTSGTLYRI